MRHVDPARLEVLAQRYRSEAEFCLEMAELADGAPKKLTYLLRGGSSWRKRPRQNGA
jgi:hypothetical protein